MGGDATNRSWRVWLSAYAPLIFWIGVILFLSSSQGSMSQTSRFIGPLLQFFFPDLPETSRIAIHGLVRKAAHVIEYAMLAILAVRALRWSFPGLNMASLWAVTAGVAALIATIDEVNQSFLASRTGSASDIALDAAGGAAGATLALLYLITRTRQRNVSV